jgi:Rrf2 family nitric oxide-sensitive transcriptional repressor
MRLTLFSDYSLRLLLYLATHQERLVSVPEVSRAYHISQNHLVKIVQLLVEKGLIESVRGRAGGLRLAHPPAEIRIGALVRVTEPDFNLVECFDRQSNTCPIAPVCGLKPVLQQAQKAFLDVLDGYTLADFIPRAPALIKIWRRELRE